MMANTYADKNGTYAAPSISCNTGYLGGGSPLLVHDTNKTAGTAVEKEQPRMLTVLEILKKILAHEERMLKSFEKQMHWNSFRKSGIGIILEKDTITLNSKNWDLACDEIAKSGALIVELVVSDPGSRREFIDRPALQRLIESMEHEQQEPVSDREVFAMLSALQLYQKRLRAQPCAEPGWQRMKGPNGLITMNIGISASNLDVWSTAFNLLCRHDKFQGGTNWDVWDLDLKLLDDIIGSLSRSMSEKSIKVGDVATSDPIESVSDKEEPDYYPSKEGMVLGHPTIEECRAQSESITDTIKQIRDQLNDTFKQSISSGPKPDVAATCLIEPMIGEYADFGIEIAKPLTHTLSQLRAAGKNPIRYACWMTCSSLVSQAKALVKPYTPRQDGCTLFEYQSALKILDRVEK